MDIVTITKNNRCKLSAERRGEEIGKKYQSNRCGIFTIIEYFDANNVTVQFEDGTKIFKKKYGCIVAGAVNNPNHPNCYSLGFEGQGRYGFKSHKTTVSYWRNMMGRCYSGSSICTVHSDWHNFQNFAKWFEENFNPEFMQKWHLDKDLLVKGNKVYGPNTCCFLPTEINSSLSHTKTDKTWYRIKAEKFKNKISQNSYNALYKLKFN